MELVGIGVVVLLILGWSKLSSQAQVNATAAVAEAGGISPAGSALIPGASAAPAAPGSGAPLIPIQNSSSDFPLFTTPEMEAMYAQATTATAAIAAPGAVAPLPGAPAPAPAPARAVVASPGRQVVPSATSTAPRPTSTGGIRVSLLK